MTDDESPDNTIGSRLHDRDPGGIGLVRDAVDQHWEDVMDDLYATAEEYEEDGWDTVTVRPGDVSIVSDDDLGEHTPIFAVTCPQSAWEGIDALFENGVEFDRAEMFRAAVDEAVFVVVVLEADAEETAVLYPLYYSPLEWEPAYTQGDDAKVYTRLRHIDGRFHQVEHDDPELFAPPPDRRSTTDEPGRSDPIPDEAIVPGTGVEEGGKKSLAELPPAELAELSDEDLTDYQPTAFRKLSDEQLDALNLSRDDT